MTKRSELSAAFAALGSPIRFSLFQRLLELGPAGAGPTELAEHVGLRRNLVSYHLQPLVTVGLVRTNKSGRDVIYSLDRGALGEMSLRFTRLALGAESAAS